MKTPRILATSGGFNAGPTQRSVRLGTMILDALSTTEKVRPRVCLVNTAGGDDSEYYAYAYEAFNAAGCDVTEMSDLVWVAGGSVANLLALWRLHGIDHAMRAAWERGVILGGASAGSLCWHVGGTTDSFGPILQPVTNGLAFLPYANGVHYDAESQRRPFMHQLMSQKVLPTLAYATDNAVGVWYEGTDATRVVSDFEMDPDVGPAAYRVELIDDEVVETRYGVGCTFT
jgi:peptidase E